MRNLSLLFLLALLGAGFSGVGQSYLLNVDFGGTTGNTPPAGWQNNMVTGAATDVWSFSNPGQRVPGTPIIHPFAIFDAAHYSSGNGPEVAELTSAMIDATGAAACYLIFSTYLAPDSFARGIVQIFNGNTWVTIDTLLTTNNQVLHYTKEITAQMAGIANSRVRFRWEGDGAGYWIVDNVKVFAPLILDGGITAINSPTMPLQAGNHNISVTLHNFGHTTINNTTINWSVNGVLQPPYAWSGNLLFNTADANIGIGSYAFPTGGVVTLKVWQSGPNGGNDPNKLNDTVTKIFYTSLCGIYTIGGSNPDYPDFFSAVSALEASGITCPVVFRVRDGVYNEQIHLKPFAGVSATNTITFEGESGDSSLVQLHYQNNNPTNDYTVLFDNASHIVFRSMHLWRSGGNYTVLITNNSSHLTFENNIIQQVLSPNTSCDSVLVFRKNNLVNATVEIDHPANNKARGIVLEKNHIFRFIIRNSTDIVIDSNYRSHFTFWSNWNIIEHSQNIQLTNNRYFLGSNSASFLYLNHCHEIVIEGNVLEMHNNSYAGVFLHLNNSRSAIIQSNRFRTRQDWSWNNGTCLLAQSTDSLLIHDNDFIGIIPSGSKTLTGILVQNTPTRIIVSNNRLDTLSIGISLEQSNAGYKALGNRINFTNVYGLCILGSGGTLEGNRITRAWGHGIKSNGSNVHILGNRISGVIEGFGIEVTNPGNVVRNNFVQAGGNSTAMGIVLTSGATGTSLQFNNIHITSTDTVNGRGLVLSGGSGLDIRNNLIRNSGGGPVLHVQSLPAASVIDFNGYSHSRYNTLVTGAAGRHDTLFHWNTNTGFDGNSILANPFYLSDTNLTVTQRLYDNNAQPIAGVSYDINLTPRNATQPDRGATEFDPCVIDAGINTILDLKSPLSVGATPIRITLMNHGAATLTGVQIGWSVNGSSQAPFAWSGSLAAGTNTDVQIGTFTFQGGSIYTLEAWTSAPNGTTDCKPENDKSVLKDLTTQLCGVYTIGGANPDFPNFSAAAQVLNTAGVSCPVTFIVRPGNYAEQIIIANVPGNSAVNTITFTSLNQDSATTGIRYLPSNLANDFVMKLSGVNHLTFDKLYIERNTACMTSIILENNCHHITFNHCQLHSLVSLPGSYDSVLTFQNCYIYPNQIFIEQPSSLHPTTLLIDSSIVGKIILNNVRDAIISNDTISNFLQSGNNYPNVSTTLININNSTDVRIEDSWLKAAYVSYATTKNIEAINSQRITIVNCTLLQHHKSSYTNGNDFIYTNNTDSLIISNNRLEQHEVYANSNSSSHFIKCIQGNHVWIDNNLILANNSQKETFGIVTENIVGTLLIENNTLKAPIRNGIHCSGTNSGTIIRNNHISQPRNISVRLQGNGGIFEHNTIDSALTQSAIRNEAAGMTLRSNRIAHTQNGSGIYNTGSNVQIYNNYIHSPVSSGPNYGITHTQGSNLNIWHNNINVHGADKLQSRCINLLSGSNIDIKNNILNNEGQGTSLWIDPSVTSLTSNYNAFASKGDHIVRRGTLTFADLLQWQTGGSQDQNSLSQYPFFASPTNLHPSNTLLVDVASPIAAVATDIDGTPRTLPDIGAKEDTLCAVDAGIVTWDTLPKIITAGVHPVNVWLQNHGTTTLSSVNIGWSINGQVLTSVPWTGNLPSKQKTLVSLGNHTFASGQYSRLKFWTSSPNGLIDCKLPNDTFGEVKVITPLCGTYTIGGIAPDFYTFTEAAEVLNLAGISCSVTFLVRPGTYPEQIMVGPVPGNSSVNTITFVADGGNFNNTQLVYSQTDTINDYTLLLDSLSYLTFRNLRIIRNNGLSTVLFKNRTHHLLFDSCSLGELALADLTGISHSTFKNCDLNHRRILFHDSTLYPKDSMLFIGCRRIRVLELSQANHLLIDSCTFLPPGGSDWNYWQTQNPHTQFIKISCSDSIRIRKSQVGQTYYWRNGVELMDVHHFQLDYNTFGINSGYTNQTAALEIQNASNGRITGNFFPLNSRNGVRLHNTSDVSISGNTIYGANAWGHAGIRVNPGCTALSIDSNTVYNSFYGISVASDSVTMTFNDVYQTSSEGFYIESGYNQVHQNKIRNINNSNGMLITGVKNEIVKNEFYQITNGTGVRLNSQQNTLTQNRFFNNSEGAAILIGDNRNMVSNNFIHSDGFGVAEGIRVGSGAVNNTVAFNSINITSTDPVKGRAFVVNSGDSLFVKNNIFANNGTGYCVHLNDTIRNGEWDYNAYFSPLKRIGFVNNTGIDSLVLWSGYVQGDVNSRFINPFFASPTELRPWQREINGAAVNAYGIDIDIDDQLRNQIAPDIGADEFKVDFGIQEMLTPTLHCYHNGIDTVTIQVKQYGDIPFKDIVIGFNVNNGPVHYDTIPGYTHNDFVHVFTTPISMSTNNVYVFKIWMVNNNDDNVANDTLIEIRHSTPKPFVGFLSNNHCYGDVTHFQSNASIAAPYQIVDHLYHFTPLDSGMVSNPNFVFPASGNFPVQYRVTTDVGCFADTLIWVDVHARPEAGFTWQNVCHGDTVGFTNTSFINSNDSLYSMWGFGVMGSSSLLHPNVHYTSPGSYPAELMVSTQHGCSDTIQFNVAVFPNPLLAMQHQHISCYNLNNGTAQVAASGASAPYHYLWTTGGTHDTVQHLAAGMYYVMVSDSNGCVSRDSVNIHNPPGMTLAMNHASYVCGGASTGWAAVNVMGGTPGYTYVWSNASASDSVTSLTAGVYQVTVTDLNGCQSSDSVLLPLQPQPQVQIAINHATCFGLSDGDALLVVGTGVPPYQFHWSTVPIQTTAQGSNLAAGIYTVLLTDSMGCARTDTVEILEPQPLSDAWLVKSVTCKDAGDGELTIQVSGGTAPYIYQWNTTPPGTVSQITGLQSGTWQVSVTDANGCDTVFRYTMLNPDSIVVTYQFTNETCAGYCDGTITAMVVGGMPPYSYLWSSSITDTSHSVTNLCPGSFHLLMTDSLGCNYLGNPIVLQPGLDVQADFSYLPSTLYAGMPVDFIYTGTTAFTWQWDFGNGITSNMTHPAGILFTDGTYDVTLIATSGTPHHCADTLVRTITVLEDPRIFVPNAFHPNGNGVNDLFYPQSIGMELLEMKVYNRWGQSVFNTTSPGEGWDGTFNGVPCPEGVYVWVLRYRNPKLGEVHEMSGSVTLLR